MRPRAGGHSAMARWLWVIGGLALLASIVVVALLGADPVQSTSALASAVAACLGLWLEFRRPRPDLPGASMSARQSIAAPVSRAPRRLRGRDGQISVLRRAVRHPSGRLVVLTGLGGVGKSAIALKMFQRTNRRRGRRAWWISARISESFTEGLVGLAEVLGGTAADSESIRAGTGRAQDRLWELLGQAPRGWLLVLDDADDLGVLGTLDGTGWVRPSTRGLVLITSRIKGRQVWGGNADIYEVRPLRERDAARMLLDLADAGSEPEARALAGRLGNLPLALRLAGSNLSSEFSRWDSFSGYQHALDAVGIHEVLASEHGVGTEPDPRHAVMSTWELSLDNLADSGITQARHLLRLLSCYAPGLPIPVNLLEADPVHRLNATSTAVGGLQTGDVGGGTDRWRPLYTGLRGLAQLSLITREPLSVGRTSMTALRLHPVVAETNRGHLDHGHPSPDGLVVRQTAVELIAAAMRPMRFDNSGIWPLANVLAPHVRQLLESTAAHLDDEHLAQLLGAAAHLVAVATWSGAERAGEQLASDALTLAGSLDTDHPACLNLRMELAWAVGRSGRWPEARIQLAAVVDAWSNLSDGEPAGLLDARHKLAWSMGRSGDWHTAYDELTTVRELRRHLLGDEHPDTLHTRCCLAWAAWRIGREAEAEASYREVIEVRGRVLGEDHIETLDARHSLAEGYVLSGRYLEAESLLRPLIVDMTRTLGPGHPETLESRPRYWLGRALRGQGRHREADNLFADLLADQLGALGADHPAVSATREGLTSRQDAGAGPN